MPSRIAVAVITPARLAAGRPSCLEELYRSLAAQHLRAAQAA